MKLNWIKAIISVVISLLLALLCFTFATEDGYRNWISFAVSFVTIVAIMIPTIAVEHKGIRAINIKTLGWMFTLLSVAVNFVFAFFAYKPIVYIAVSALVSVIGVALVYTMIPRK
ncbi:MAG: hypothetical protein II815_00465 [Bacteroidales bacterium]|nr:hypothetical protein [Bacteroidales bacterium]